MEDILIGLFDSLDQEVKPATEQTTAKSIGKCAVDYDKFAEQYSKLVDILMRIKRRLDADPEKTLISKLLQR